MEIAQLQILVIVVWVGRIVYVVLVSILSIGIDISETEMSVFFFPLAICSPACEHSSNCTAPNTCVCSAGYNGSYCQDRKFFIINDFFPSKSTFCL